MHDSVINLFGCPRAALQVEARLPVTNLMKLDVSPADLKDIGGVPDTGPMAPGPYASQADADTAALQVPCARCVGPAIPRILGVGCPDGWVAVRVLELLTYLFPLP